jgi:hypothetical protein
VNNAVIPIALTAYLVVGMFLVWFWKWLDGLPTDAVAWTDIILIAIWPFCALWLGVELGVSLILYLASGERTKDRDSW